MRDWWSERRTKEEVSGGVWRGSIFVNYTIGVDIGILGILGVVGGV